MTKHKFRLSLVKKPSQTPRGLDTYTIALDGHPVGPAMVDEESARLILNWLHYSQDSLNHVVIKTKIDLTFEQILGIGWPPKVRAIEAQENAPTVCSE